MSGTSSSSEEDIVAVVVGAASVPTDTCDEGFFVVVLNVLSCSTFVELLRLVSKMKDGVDVRLGLRVLLAGALEGA